VLGFVNVYPFIFSFVADHFQYLASISIIALVAAGLTLALKRFQLAALLLVSLLGILTWRQARMYRDAETLYSVTLARNPDCWMAHNNLSTVLFAKGDIDGAMAHSDKALAIRPNDYEPHLTLGDALVRKQRYDDAIAHFEEALKLKPDYAETHTHLGSAHLAQRKPVEAIAEFEKTLALAPNSLYASNDLAWLLATCPDVSLRNGTRAVQLAEKANRVAGGDNASILRTLAAAYAQSGQIARAIETAQQATKLAGTDHSLAAGLQKDIELYRSHLR
jgi:tetratricopeptide (TPR) repeat protein